MVRRGPSVLQRELWLLPEVCPSSFVVFALGLERGIAFSEIGLGLRNSGRAIITTCTVIIVQAIEGTLNGPQI